MDDSRTTLIPQNSPAPRPAGQDVHSRPATDELIIMRGILLQEHDIPADEATLPQR
jgi:hypothetical protein